MKNIIIDGSPLIYASYFTLRDKINFWLVFGVLNSILTIIEEEQPSTLAIVWGSRQIDKRIAYPMYRTGSNRTKIDFDQKQYNRVIEILTSLGTCQLKLEGLEADQVLAAYVNSVKECTIISDDKDFFQLLNDTKRLKGPRRGEWTADKVIQEYHIKHADMFADWQALAGDPVDTIPRVLYTKDVEFALKQKGYLKDWLLKPVPDLTGLPSRVVKKLEGSMSQARMNYLLVNLRDERLTDSMLMPTAIDLNFAQDKFYKMQMNIFLKKFDKFASLGGMNLAVKRETVGLK